MTDARVAVVTGANSGVGLAIAQRLLSISIAEIVVLACRSQTRAAQARAQLLAEFPRADVRLVELDTSSVASVLAAAQEITALGRVDLLFCNAGAMAIASLDVCGIVRGLLTHPIAFFESSEALVQRRGLLSGDGLGLTFQTNVFGHYLLIHKLTDLMAATNACVIWTGSSASRLEFSMADYQHVHGAKPYESSKYIVDQIAVPLDARLHKRGVRCFVAEPGNVRSGFMAGLDIPVLQLLIAVVFFLLRTLGFRRFTIDAGCASAACIFIALAAPDKLDPRIKYFSNASPTGQPSVMQAPLPYHKPTADFLIAKLDALVSRFDQPK
ncbi:hypothetical protein IWW50_000002 [Coemansia erecta]|nr:hypothetical protein GGF43_000126 [Coemansia sp. RSA 2618]KAJ2830781.1 hypothetical protein IWW50_000002 [Coemansia erecta]